MTSDPYIWDEKCINRLLEEYRKHKRLIVAVDFDGTVFDYHKEGNTHDYVIDVVKKAQAAGFLIVLWTASKQERWEDQKKFLFERGVRVDAVNANPILLPYGNNRKIYYNILLDDRAGLGQAVYVLSQVLERIENDNQTSARH